MHQTLHHILAEQLRKLVHAEHPTAQSEVHDGVVRIAIGQGESRLTHVVSLASLDASTPEEAHKLINEAVSRGRKHRS